MEAEHQVGEVLDELSSKHPLWYSRSGDAESSLLGVPGEPAVCCHCGCGRDKPDGSNTGRGSLGADSGNERTDGNLADGRNQGLLSTSLR